MRWHTTNHLKRDERRPDRLVHRGFWLDDVPRLMLWCRIRGHRPVVDGYGPHKPGGDASRWVTCDRCGVRPDPQGNLSPKHFDVGQPYTHDLYQQEFVQAMRELGAKTWGPGPWPDKPTGVLGGELVIGKTFGAFAVEVKVGNGGSEQTLAAHLRIWPFGALYLHTERFGTWLQRRLNPTGYESRVISLSADGWRIRTQLWARRDSWSRDDPWWMHGSVSLDLVEKVFGPKRYSYEDADVPTLGWVKMPEGDSYQVQLKLKRVRLGRPRLKRAIWSWSVEWSADSPGIATRPGKGGYIAAAVRVPEEAVEARCWDAFACALIAKELSEERTRYGYRPENMEG
jgi:hypothetical protein